MDRAHTRNTGGKRTEIEERTGEKKAEAESGWLFPVGNEASELGYADMFDDMLNAMDEGREPMETFYDGYVVNAVVDACYRSARSKRWEPVELAVWRGAKKTERIRVPTVEREGCVVIKQERMQDGRTKLILKDERTGEFSQRVVEQP